MMVQNRNLGLLLQKLFDDEQILERILLSNDMHELYVICLTIQDGYSYEEFVEFFNCLVSGCMEDLKHINEMSPDELENVSGGRGEFNKAASATLASFLALTSVSAHSSNTVMPSASDAYRTAVSLSADRDQDEEYDAVTVIDGHLLRKKVQQEKEKEEEEEEKKEEKGGAGGFLSRKLKGLYEGAKRNKGKIFIAAALATLAVGGAYVTRNKSWGFNKQVDRLTRERQAQKTLEDPGSKKAQRQQAVQTLRQLKKEEAETPNKGLLGKISDLLPVKGVIAGGIAVSGVKGILNTVKDITSWGGGLAKDLSEMRKLVEKIVPNWLLGGGNEPDYEYEENKNLTPEERLANLDKDLELLKGQKEAKKQIRKFLATIENARKRWKEGIWAKTGVNLLVFNGPSGTGKTFAASILAKNISTIKPYIITADELLRSGQDALSMWGRKPTPAQLLLSAEHKNQDGTVDNFPKSLSAYVTKYGDQGMILIDEFDKLMINSSKEERRALEELFRTLMDSGIVKSQYGDEYDFRGMTIVLTTNETTASLEGRIIERPDGSFVEMIKDADGNIQYVTPTQDATGTQTLVAHDPSFTQRLRGSICTFNCI